MKDLSENRTSRVTVRLTELERKWLEEEATKRGIKIS